MAYVNETKKNYNIYDIHDKRIPEIVNADNDKAVLVDVVNGGFKFGANGTPVIANPTMEGGEAELNSLQVGNTKYKIAGFSINTTTSLALPQDSLDLISDGNKNYYVNGNREWSGHYLDGINTGFIYSQSEERNACWFLSNLLQQLGITFTATSLDAVFNMWNDGDGQTAGSAWHESQYAFLIMACILYAMLASHIEFFNMGYYTPVYLVGDINSQDPTQSTFTIFNKNVYTDNGETFMNFKGTTYSFADTATIQSWRFMID